MTDVDAQIIVTNGMDAWQVEKQIATKRILIR